jgi:hypothetical protein
MRSRPLFAASCLALAVGTSSLFGQPTPSSLPVPAAAPIPPASPTPAGADCCAPAPCPVKSFCDHFKGAPAPSCAPQPIPKITVVVPPPQVVFRPASTAGPCGAGHACVKRPAAPVAPPAAPPTAPQSYLVPQLSYALQPVVSMQAVPTVSYGVVAGPVPPVAAPYPAAPAVPAAFCPPCPTSDVDTVVRLIKLLKELAGVGLGTGLGTDSPNADTAKMIKELDAAIKQTRQDLYDLSSANHNNIASVVEALKADTKIDQKTKDSLPKVVPVGPVKK